MKGNLTKLVDGKIRQLLRSDKSLEALYGLIMANKNNIWIEKNASKYTYKQIGCFIDAVTNKFVNVKEKYIGLDMPTSLEWIIVFWAILKSGHSPFLINPRLTKPVIEEQLNLLGIKLIVTNNNCYAPSMTLNISEADYLNGSKEKTTVAFGSEIAISTSGTMGQTKIVLFSGENIMNEVFNSREIIRTNNWIMRMYHHEIKVLALLPFYHVFGLIVSFLWFSFFGCTLVTLENLSTNTILNTIRVNEVTHIFAPPILFHTVEKKVRYEINKLSDKQQEKVERVFRFCRKVQNVFPSFGIFISKLLCKKLLASIFGKSVMFCITGGGYIRKDALELFNTIGYPLYNGYGTSEIGITSVELRRKYLKRTSGSVGQPFPNVKYAIDENEQLVVSGATVASKLIINKEVIENPKCFFTEDMFMEKEGYYYIYGRMNDLFIGDNGENINPDMLEKEINLNVSNFVVLTYKEALSLIVQVSRYSDRNLLAGLYKEIKNTLSSSPLLSKIQTFYYTFDHLMNEDDIKINRRKILTRISENKMSLYVFSKELIEVNEIEFNEELLSKIINIVNSTLIDCKVTDPKQNLMLDLKVDSITYISILYALNEEFSLTESIPFSAGLYSIIDIYQFIEKHLK